MKNFWQKLNKSFYAMAPMAGVSDSAFRQVCKDFGADVVYSEMASVAALCYNPKKTLELLEFSEKERPYVVQLFGSEAKQFAEAARIVTKEINPDGIDINFGCPVKKVAKQGAGAVLMRDKKKSREIIISTIENTELPISIKTRAQVDTIDALEFLDYMHDLDIKALMIHGRTLAQGFSGDINFDIIKKARDYFGGIIMVNGGINSLDDGIQALKKTGADGLGIARGALGCPWIFQELKNNKKENKNPEKIFEIAFRHAGLAESLKGQQGIIEMRKHLCWYVHGIAGASEMRRELINVSSLNEIKNIFNSFGFVV